MRFALSTNASPEQVLRAMTDFTDRRVEIWHKTLDPKVYQLCELGETWAVAREGSPRVPFWVVVHYEWSNSATPIRRPGESSESATRCRAVAARAGASPPRWRPRPEGQLRRT
jgi:hypothetical protein